MKWLCSLHALQIRAAAPGRSHESVAHAFQLMLQLWLTGRRPSSRACASVLRRCSPVDAALLLQRMSLHGPRITPHILAVALHALSAQASLSLLPPVASPSPPSQSRRFICPAAIRTQQPNDHSVWLLESLQPCLHHHASALASLNIADVQLPRALPLRPCDMRALQRRVLSLIVAIAPCSEVARIADAAPAATLSTSAVQAMVCRLAADNDAVRAVDLLTRPRGMGSCITRSLFNFTARKLLAGKSTHAAVTVALVAGRYWTMCSARVMRALLHALADQPPLLHGGSYVASTFNAVADVLRSHVAPLHEVHDLMFQAKNAAAALRCSVMMRDVQQSFKAAADLNSIACTPGVSPAVVLHCAKAMSCAVGSHADDSRAVHLLKELCCLPALQAPSAVRACALEILSSRTMLKSAAALPLQARVHKIQAACSLCVAKQYPLQLLAANMQAVLAQDSQGGVQVSSLRLQVSRGACWQCWCA